MTTRRLSEFGNIKCFKSRCSFRSLTTLPALAACAAALAVAPTARAQSCVGDLNGDRIVNGSDLGILLGQWEQVGTGDLDGNGFVSGSDLGLLLVAWGPCSVTVPSWATLVEAMPDPAVVTDSTLRAAITASGMAWRVRDNGTNIEMLLVPLGTFTMGCSASTQYGCEPDESLTHQVTLTQGFLYGSLRSHTGSVDGDDGEQSELVRTCKRFLGRYH
jgi:formylglycine-generating enzyme required for sulfatase activity